MELDEAIIEALLNDIILMGLVSDVGYHRIPEGGEVPYVIVRDVSALPHYGMGASLRYSEAIYQIECYAEDTSDASAETVSKNILKQVNTVLHNQALVINDEVWMSGTRGQRIPSDWATINTEDEQVYRSGHRWNFTTSRVSA